MKINTKLHYLTLTVLLLIASGLAIYLWTINLSQKVELKNLQDKITTLEQTENNLTTKLTKAEKDAVYAKEIYEQLKKPLQENQFRYSTLKVGDKVAGMTTKSIEPLRKADISEENLAIGFSGQTTLSGTYNYYGDDESFHPDTVCFEADAASIQKIPAIFPNGGNPFFCFSNNDFAKEYFKVKGSSGKAEIIIDDFQFNYAPIEVWNGAKLIKVIKKD
ncbi:hypothetical protein IT411_04110 [Candidatus Peregrinibacteria bacterium]|nr:hypothetical protein [Candidatus Peregrinibacteria bacterium]